MTEIRTGFFTYPWDLIEQGADKIINQMVNENNVNAIMVNALYHHARVLRPRANGPKTLQYNQAFAAFKPNPELYDDKGLIPTSNPGIAKTKVLLAVKDACNKHNIDFGIWIVGLHNSTLGIQNPENCVENCFGDKYTYSLCPNQEKNQRYILSLIRDVCTQFEPDRILVEAIGILGLKHWVHHELFMTEWDETLEMLTSICFCSACVQNGELDGIDVQGLRETIIFLGNQLLNDERGALPPEFTLSDIPSLLLEIDGLTNYLQINTKSISNFVEEIYKVTKELKVKLEISPSSFHRPVSRAWMERISLKALAKVTDGVIISSYFNSSSEVEADLKWAKYISPDLNLSAGINACAPTPSEAELIAQSMICVQEGCKGIYFYNYGLLNDKRLEWVSKANKMILDINKKENK